MNSCLIIICWCIAFYIVLVSNVTSFLYKVFHTYLDGANLDCVDHDDYDMGTQAVPDLGLGTLGTCTGASTRKGLHKSRH